MLDQDTLYRTLRDKVLSGRCVLFLGAGCSKQAGGPFASELRDELASQFLSAPAPHEDLTKSIDIICSQPAVDVQDVKRYVAERVDRIGPTPTHACVTHFPWPAIFTTNYDRVVEKAYDREREAGSTVDFQVHHLGQYFALVRPDKVPIFKLFGCSGWLRDPRIPFVLTSEDFVDREAEREAMLAFLGDLNQEYTWLFAGYSFNDGVVLRLIEELHRKVGRYATRWSYALLPQCRPELRAFFQNEHNRILVLDETFEDFFARLCQEAEAEVAEQRAARAVKDAVGTPYPLQLSLSELERIDREFEVVGLAKDSADSDPRDFYTGNSPGWSDLRLEYDVRRECMESLRFDLLNRLRNGFQSPYTVLVTASAGAGKTTALRRLAYDLHLAGYPVLRMLDGARWSVETIELFWDRLLAAGGQDSRPICIIVDNVDKNPGDLRRLQQQLRSSGISALVVGAARPAPLNILLDELADVDESSWQFRVDQVCELKEALTENEAHQLAARLENLGILPVSPETPMAYWIDQFCGAGEGGLLVILSELLDEARRRFEPIVLGEYEQITSALARAAYQYTAACHRYGVLIRGEHLRRTLGCEWWHFFEEVAAPLDPSIDLQKLQTLEMRAPRLVDRVDPEMWEQLIDELIEADIIKLSEEHPREYWTRTQADEARLRRETARLVISDYNSITGEQFFRTRHRRIAEVLSSYLFGDGSQLAGVVAKILASMRPEDPFENRTARNLLRSRELMNDLSQSVVGEIAEENRRLVFRSALSVAPRDLVILQHFGITEMNYGNYAQARDILSHALTIDEDNEFIIHSLGLLYARWSSEEEGLLKDYYFQQAIQQYDRVRSLAPESEYPYIAWSEALIRRAQQAEEAGDDQEYLRRVSEALALIQEGLRVVPVLDQVRLPKQIARLSSMVAGREEAREILAGVVERTHDPNAYRALAMLELDKTGINEALAILQRGIDKHRQNLSLLSMKAELLLDLGTRGAGEADAVLREVCVGSRRPDDHVRAGAVAFMQGKPARERKAFEKARNLAGLRPRTDVRRVRVMWMEAPGRERRFEGLVEEAARPGQPGSIAFEKFRVLFIFGEEKNASLRAGDKVSFVVGFSLLGPRALSITPI